MKKRLYFVIAILTAMIALSLCSVTTVYASELNEVYTFEDNSSTSIFTLKDETTYECKLTSTETGDTAVFTGQYIKQENKIIFYLAEEVLLQAEIGEDNLLTEVILETPAEPILPDMEEIEKIKGIEEYTAQVVEWIIAGVLGLMGTLAVAIAFRKQLKSLITKILEGLSILKVNKDTAEEDIKNIKKEADSTLASLKTVKEEMFEVNKKEFEELKRQNKLLYQVIMYMAGGMKELVVNGTSETVCNLLKEFNKEVQGNASEEI